MLRMNPKYLPMNVMDTNLSSYTRNKGTILLFEEALASREWALGPYHPDTLAARHHLAHAYRGPVFLKRP
jgi:hypothetical protein